MITLQFIITTAVSRGTTAIVLTSLLLACSSQDPEPRGEIVQPERDAVTTITTPRAALSLVQKGYVHKKAGQNAKALSAFETACNMMASSVGKSSDDYASCLDDQASVHLRMGNFEESRELYEEALKLIEESKGADPRLTKGISKRLALIDAMEKKGFKCAEPKTPLVDSPLPYFPDVPAYQKALGLLNPVAADCKEGAPEAVTLRVTIAGDGTPLRAEARGHYAGTDLGKCVEDKILAAIPTAALPKFRACFRGFTYPYMVGTHRSDQTGKKK